MSATALKQRPALIMSGAALVLAMIAIVMGPINLVGAIVDGGETCRSVTPNFRAADTRTNQAPSGKVSGNGTINVTVAGVGGIPANAKTVKIQLTAANLTGPDESFLVAYPAGTARPPSSSLNPRGEHTTSNGALPVAVGTNGQITVFNNAGATHVIVDVVEWCDDHTHDTSYYTKAEIDAMKPIAASAEVDNVTDPTANVFGVAATVTITVPVDGLIQAVGSTLATGAQDDIIDCELTLGPGNVANTPEFEDTDRRTHMYGTEHFCSTNGAAAVTAGTHVINLVVRRSAATVDFDDATLDVIFTPGGTLSSS